MFVEFSQRFLAVWLVSENLEWGSSAGHLKNVIFLLILVILYEFFDYLFDSSVTSVSFIIWTNIVIHIIYP